MLKYKIIFYITKHSVHQRRFHIRHMKHISFIQYPYLQFGYTPWDEVDFIEISGDNIIVDSLHSWVWIYWLVLTRKLFLLNCMMMMVLVVMMMLLCSSGLYLLALGQLNNTHVSPATHTYVLLLQQVHCTTVDTIQ